MDVNFTKLAGVLTGFSTNLQKGERVLIDAFDIPEDMVVALVRAARGRGAVPFVNIQRARISRELINDLDAEQFETQATWELFRMQKMDAYIAVRGSDNIFEMSDVDPSKLGQVMKAMKGVLDYRVNKTKWVILRWPTSAMAQQAMMSTESFEEFFFRVCTQDYSRMTEGMAALEALMTAIHGDAESHLTHALPYVRKLAVAVMRVQTARTAASDAAQVLRDQRELA